VSYYLKKDDILVERSNSPEYVGISCLYDHEDDEYIYPDLIMRMHLLNGMIPKYVVTVLQSPFVRKYFKTNASGSSKSMPKINQQVVSATLIPIPPQEEQKRIVLELDKLFPQLQRLETTK
jgi:type I restriction enzyme S subunit